MWVMTRRRPNAALLQVEGVRAEVTYKDVKNLRMRVVPPDGTVKISVPYGVSKATVEEFVRNHRQWLAKAREQVRRAHPPQDALTHGARVRLWGRWHEVRVTPGDRPAARLEDGVIYLSGAGEEVRHAALEELYRQEIRGVLPELLALWEPRVGREHGALRLRRMKSRWGSCNTRTGSITVNTALAEHPPSALEYVLVHELVHLIERGHGPGFYAEMAALLPDWKKRRAALRQGS